MSKKRPFFSTAVLSILGRSGGFLIPFVIAAVYGANPSTDAFFFAYAIVLSLINIFSHIFESALVPYLVERKASPERVSAFANGILWLALPAALLMAGAIGLVLFLFTQGRNPEFSSLIVSLLFEMIPSFLLSILVAESHSLFLAYKRFWFPAFSPFFRSLAMILSWLGFHSSLGIHALTLGFLAGEILRFLIAIFLLKRLPRRPWKIPPADFQEIFAFYRQAGFQVLALAAINLMFLVDQGFALPFGEGKISLINYADRLLQAPYLLFFNGIVQVFLPFWSEGYQENVPLFWARVKKDVRVVFWAALGFTVLLWIFRYGIIQVTFFLGKFSRLERLELTAVFGWLALGFLPGVLSVLYARVLFILRKSRLYCLQIWAGFAVKIFLNSIFSRRFGLEGIALSTFLVYSLSALWLHFYIQRMSRAAVPSKDFR